MLAPDIPHLPETGLYILNLTVLSDPYIGVAPTATTWGTADRAVFMPFRLVHPVIICKLGWFNGTNTTGDADAGIYSRAGTRIVSTGQTARSGSPALQLVDTADVCLPPGLYYAALNVAHGSGSIVATGVQSAVRAETIGFAIQTSAFPLPDAATFATSNTSVTPVVLAALRTDVS